MHWNELRKPVLSVSFYGKELLKDLETTTPPPRWGWEYRLKHYTHWTISLSSITHEGKQPGTEH